MVYRARAVASHHAHGDHQQEQEQEHRRRTRRRRSRIATTGLRGVIWAFLRLNAPVADYGRETFDDADDVEAFEDGDCLDPLEDAYFAARNACRKINAHPHFNSGVMFLIVANCVVMALEDPTQRSTPQWSVVASMVFTVLFTLELCVRFMALGACGYFAVGWNVMDFVVVVESVVSLAITVASGGENESSGLAVLRCLRVLRPLRTAHHVPAVKIVVEALLASLPSIGYTFIVFIFYLVICAMIFVLLFNGMFATRCLGTDGELMAEDAATLCRTVPRVADDLCEAFLFMDDPFTCGTDGAVCSDAVFDCLRDESATCDHLPSPAMARSALEPPTHGFVSFDHIGWALLQLFLVTALEGWGMLMAYTQHVMSFSTVLLFLLVIMTGTLMICNLLIAAILIRLEDAIANERTDEDAKEARKLRKSFRTSARETFVRRCGAVCWSGVRDPYLRYLAAAEESPLGVFIGVCILAACCVLALDGYGISNTMAAGLAAANLALTGVFAGELVFKVFVLGVADYFSNPFNVFDFGIVAGALVELGLNQRGSLSVLRIVRMVRLLRVLRVGRLARKFRSVRLVLTIIAESMKRVWPILMMFLLWLFITAVLSMQLFGATVHGDPKIRFDDFGWSVMMNFFVTIGEGWSDIMYHTMAETVEVSCVYFIAVFIFGNYLLLNLVLAVVLSVEGLSDNYRMQELNRIIVKVYIARESRSAFGQWAAVAGLEHRVRRHGSAAALEGGAPGANGDARPVTPSVAAVEAGPEVASPSGRVVLPPVGADATTARKAPGAIAEVHVPPPATTAGKAPGAIAEVHVPPPATTAVEAMGATAEVHAPPAGRSAAAKFRTAVTVVKFANRLRRAVIAVPEVVAQAAVVGEEDRTHRRDVIEYAKTVTGGTEEADAESRCRAKLRADRRLSPQKKIKRVGSFTLVDRKRQRDANIAVSGTAAGLFERTTDAALVEVAAAPPLWGEGMGLAANDVIDLADSVVYSVWFGKLILVCIVVSTLCMVVDADGPGHPVNVLGYACLAVFTAELLLAVAAIGPAAYASSPWNRLDAIIVLASFAAIVFDAADLRLGSRVCHVFRACRPLRIIKRIESLHQTVAALTSSVRAIGTVFTFVVFAFFAWGIIGMQLYKGEFWSCSDPDFKPGAPLMGAYKRKTQTTPWKSPPCRGHWVNADGEAEFRDFELTNADFHFDNIGNAMLSVFILSCGGWGGIMQSAMDASDPGCQPEENKNRLSVMPYFFFGATFMGLYLLSLFVGVIFEAYAQIRATSEHGGLLSPEDQRWLDYQTRLAQVVPVPKPPRPKGPVRGPLFDVATSPAFDAFITGVLVLNAATLAMQHAGQSSGWDTAVDASNCVFAVVFAAEATIKLAGLGCDAYFKHAPNVFDFCISVVSVVDTVMFVSGQCTDVDAASLRFLRSLRVFRVLRLAKLVPGAENIIVAVTYPYVKLMQVCLLLVIVIFCFASLGVALFGETVDLPQNLPPYVYANFSATSYAMELLLIVATGDMWSDIMSASFASAPAGWKWCIVGYFVAFTLTVQFIFLNLFVMVICESFEILGDAERNTVEEAIKLFKAAWADVDPTASGAINAPKLLTVLRTLPPPLGTGPGGTYHERMRIVYFLKAHRGYNFQFDQTLMGLVELWRHGVDSIDPAVFDKDAFTRQVGASVLRKCVRAWHARREHRKEYAQRMVRAAGVGGQLD